MSAGSRTEPGGYTEPGEAEPQFEISDERSPATIARVLDDLGYDPVWKDDSPVLRRGQTGSRTSVALGAMQLRVFVEPQQGATYATLLAFAQEAEKLGFDAFFRSDHYLKMGDVSGFPGPTDAWMTLAGLARETSTIRLGTLVTSATFRLPGPLAISVAQVDEMSGGRVELGLGTGWYDGEHAAYGIPFGSSFNERFEKLTEQLEIITGLWETPDDQTFSFEGKHYQVKDSPALPKPVQSPRPPIVHRRVRPEAHAATRGAVRGRVQRPVRAGQHRRGPHRRRRARRARRSDAIRPRS